MHGELARLLDAFAGEGGVGGDVGRGGNIGCVVPLGVDDPITSESMSCNINDLEAHGDCVV